MIIVQIAGHLGSDPETRYTPNNMKVTTFRVATNIKRGQKEKTVWWRVTIWGDRFDKKLAYLKKGSPVQVVGEMGIPEIYTDKSGNPQTSFEITADMILFNPFGGGKGERAEGEGADAQYAGSSAARPAMSQGSAAPSNFQEDDLPF